MASPSQAADWTDANDPTVTYTALKSINGDASGYINTGIIPAGTEGVRFKYKSTAVSTTQCIYCSRWKKSSTWQYYFTCVIASSKFRVDRAKTQYTCNTAGTLTAGEEYSLFANYNTGTVTINGTDEAGSMGTGAYTSSTPSHPLVLLGAYIGGGTASAPTVPSVDTKANGDLYYFQLWSSTGVLEHNFMPAVRDSNSSDTGLYDTVTGTFYPATDGSFTGISYGAAERAGKKWTGLGADNKMSTAANWANNDKPGAGDDIDFTIAVPFAEIDADINATFGKVYLGAADLPAFSGALTATAINDLTRMQAYDTATAGFTFTLAAPSGQDFTWNAGAAANWSTTDASWLYNSAASVWYDNNNAIFNTADATATLTADATADSLVFSQPATVAGSATLTVPSVAVAADVSATISAPTAGALAKIGAGTLTLTQDRADATTLTAGTLKMDGASVAGLTLGEDGGAAVVFDYGGQTLTADPSTYLVTGSEVTLTNGTFSSSGTFQIRDNTKIPSVLTIAKDASLVQASGTFYMLKDNGTATINVQGGTLGSASGSGASYLQHGSDVGRLNVNVTEGGRWEYPSTLYALCNGTKGTHPSLYMTFSDSTFIVGASFLCGNTETRPTSVTGAFAATNSVISVANSFYIGYNSDDNKAGSLTADFEDCIVTAKSFAVYCDHPLNNALFNGTTFVFGGASGSFNASDDEDNWITVGANGMTFDTQAYSATLNANLGGSGAITKVGAGTLTVQSNQTASAALNVNDGTLELIAGLSVARPISVAIGAVLKFQGEATLASLALAADSTNDVAVVSPITLSGGLTLPESGVAALTFNGGAFPVGIYSLFAYTGAAAADGAKFAPDTNGETATWSVINGALTLTVGNPPNTWIGGATGNLSDQSSWSRGTVPGRGETAVVAAGSSATLTVGASFSPDVIIIPEGSADVTFSGETAITGVSAITNLSSSICTFEVPVAFADKIDVYQTAYYIVSSGGNEQAQNGGHVRFAGGVTGSSFAEGTSRMLEGAYSVSAAADWQADEAEERLWSIVEGSLTISGTSGETPAPTNTHMLFVDTTGAFTTGVMRTSSRLSYRVYGEYVVTDELEVAMTADTYIAQRYGGTYKFEKLTLSDEGTGTGWKFCLANSTQKIGTKHVYIGAGGVNINAAANKTTALMCGFDDQSNSHDTTHLHPWHGDYAINGKGGSTRDLLIYRATYLHTDDENGVARTVTLNGIADVRAALTVNGSGRFQVNSDGMNSGSVTVTDTATLAYASGADLGAGAVTVGVNATMEVASGVNTFGGLTVRDGATLAFNFTERAVTPQIAIADGKTLTVNGAVNVKIPEGSLRPTGGEHVLTTCGGFTAENVTLVAGAPKWVRGLSVNADGNIVLDVKPMGTVILFR